MDTGLIFPGFREIRWSDKAEYVEHIIGFVSAYGRQVFGKSGTAPQGDVRAYAEILLREEIRQNRLSRKASKINFTGTVPETDTGG